MYTRFPNRVFVHAGKGTWGKFFLHSIGMMDDKKKGFFPQFWSEPEIPEKIRSFVKRIIPEKYRIGKYTTDRGRILISNEINHFY